MLLKKKKNTKKYVEVIINASKRTLEIQTIVRK